MEIQKAILLFFSGIHCDFMDAVAKAITVFGEDLVPLAVVLLIYWCIDKKKGFISAFIMFFADIVMFTLKAIVRFPRPWRLIPELDSQRLSTATGYSFPSGHSTTASSFFSSIAFSFRKKWISIACAAIVLLVPVSRMYLCVHWPMDVVCGLIIGVGSTLILHSKIAYVYDNKEKFYGKIIICGVSLMLIGLVMAILVQAGLIDDTAFSGFSKNLGMFSGVLIAFALEEKYCEFSIEGSIGQKIVRYLVGMAVAVALLEGVKLVLPYVPVISFFRYFAVAMWVCLYPMVGKKLKLFK